MFNTAKLRLAQIKIPDNPIKIQLPWFAGQILSLVVSPDDGVYSDPVNDLTIKTRPVTFQVDTDDMIGSEAFMKCYRAKILLDEKVYKMVAKRYYPLEADLDYYIQQLQVYLHSRAVLARFQTNISNLDQISQHEKNIVNSLRVSHSYCDLTCFSISSHSLISLLHILWFCNLSEVSCWQTLCQNPYGFLKRNL